MIVDLHLLGSTGSRAAYLGSVVCAVGYLVLVLPRMTRGNHASLDLLFFLSSLPPLSPVIFIVQPFLFSFLFFFFFPSCRSPNCPSPPNCVVGLVVSVFFLLVPLFLTSGLVPSKAPPSPPRYSFPSRPCCSFSTTCCSSGMVVSLVHCVCCRLLVSF